MTTLLNALVTCVAGDGDPYVKVQFKDLADAQQFHASLAMIAKPVAWRHTLKMELGQTETRLTFDAANPFGAAGKDYDQSYMVLAEPLYTTPPYALSESDAPQAQVVPPMPATKDRQPYSDVGYDGYLESDMDWARENSGAVEWLADNHAAIRAALTRHSTTEAKPVEQPDKFAYWNSLPEAEKAKIREDWARDMFGDADD